MNPDATDQVRSCGGCRLLAAGLTLVVLVCGVALLESWARRELRREDALAAASRDRSPVTYFIEDSRLHPFTAADDTNALRIVIIGDSITRGANCFYADSFGSRLERLLNLNVGVRPARVDVYAEAGTGTLEQRRLLNQALKDGRADVVLLAYCLNDTEDFSRAEELAGWRKAYETPEHGKLLQTVTNLSRFAEWRVRETDMQKMRAGTDSYYRRLYDTSYSGVKRMEVGMRYFRDTCRSSGATLAVVVMPLLDASGVESLDFARGLVTNMTFKLGVPTLDLRDDFSGRTPLRMTTVPGEDGHLSEIAHRIAAEAIFEFLLANSMVDASYTPANMNTTPKKFEITRLAPRRVVSGPPDAATPPAKAPDAPPAAN